MFVYTVSAIELIHVRTTYDVRHSVCLHLMFCISLNFQLFDGRTIFLC